MGIENLVEINKKLRKIKVADIMSRFAITTSPETSIMDLAHLLMRFKISGVPVVSQNKIIVGIVTATDLFDIMNDMVFKLENGQVQENGKVLYVKDIMVKNVFSVTNETPLFDALKLMIDKNIYTLPVVSDNEITGIIGRRDVINSFYANKD